LTPLNSIAGQETAKKILLSSFNRNRLASTYLFYGPDGVGKWSTALALTALVNCEDPVKNDAGEVLDACGRCLNCRQVLSLNFAEFYPAVPLPPHRSRTEAADLVVEYIEAKKKEPYRTIVSSRQLTIPIDTAREIKRRTAIKPPPGMTRVILFYQMEKMLPSSADSLLKLIEEPPPETIILLTTVDPDSLLPTIQSRSQKVAFKPLSPDDIVAYLKTRHEVTDKRANLLGRLSEGSIGRALAFCDEEGESSLREIAFLMFKTLFIPETPAAVGTLNDLIDPRNRGAAAQVLSHWQSFLSDIILLKYGADSTRVVNIDLAGDLEKMSVRFLEPDDISAMVEYLKNIGLMLRRNVHIRPALLALALQMRRRINQSS